MVKVFLAVVALCLLGLAVIIVPNMMRQGKEGQLTVCKSNLKNIGTALAMYASDHKGEFPKKLDDLTPANLKEIPLCYYDRAGKEKPTTPCYAYEVAGKAYTVYCVSGRHADYPLPPNYPQFTSARGLIVKP